MEVNIAQLVGGGYRDFWQCRARYRVLKGGKASKKSTTTALWFIYHLMKYPDANLLVVRNVQLTHGSSTFAQLKWAVRRLHVEHLWRWTVSPLMMEYRPTGQKILFRGFDDPDKLASTTVERGRLCWVWVEEAFEIASETAFERLDLSVPRGTVPEPLFKQTTITFNPWSETHWLKKRFFDRASPDTAVFSTNYLCNEFLDETDIRIYERMKLQSPRRYAVAGLGEWGAADGLVFENWVVEEFDVQALPEPWKYRHVFGLDYGYTNDPTAFIAMAVNPVDKRLYVYDEHYQRRMLNGDIAAMIRAKGFAKERIRADSAEPKSNEELRRQGIGRITAAVKGRDSVQSGIAKIQEYRIVVHPACVNTVAELSSYVWQRDGGGNSINRPVDRDNHLMDAMRYAMEDVKFFRPQPPGHGARAERGGLIRPEDFKGGWNV